MRNAFLLFIIYSLIYALNKIKRLKTYNVKLNPNVKLIANANDTIFLKKAYICL